MSVKISSKYQVVIPQKAREALKLKPGTQIDVIVKGAIAYLVPVKTISEVRKGISTKLSHHDRSTLRDKKDRKL